MLNFEICFPFANRVTEEKRLREAYARRHRSSLYSRFNRAYLFWQGDLLRDFIKWGARSENVLGVELLDERVSEAIHLCPKDVKIQQGNAADLQFPDEMFDLVLQSTVFTSVLDPEMKQQMAAEMCRVLKREGLILWYDYHMNNPKNAAVRGVKLYEIEGSFPTARFACTGYVWHHTHAAND